MSDATNNLMEISSLVGYRLRELRIKAGYSSYEQFAYDFQLSRIQYWKMENGNNFTLKSLLRVLDSHQLSIEDFLTSINNSNATKTDQANRLLQLITHLRLTKKEFCTNMGYKNLTNINHILLGGKSLSKVLLQRIKDTYPTVNTRWLTNGEGSMLIFSGK